MPPNQFLEASNPATHPDEGAARTVIAQTSVVLSPVLADAAAVPAGLSQSSTKDIAAAQAPALLTRSDLETYFSQVAAELEAAHELVQQASLAGEGQAHPATLVDSLPPRCVVSLRPPPDCAELQPASQVTLALEGLLKKLLEHPNNATPSTLQALANAVDLLRDLCVPGLPAGLASDPPVQLLVVDDDPLARRAIICGLQLAFGRPDNAPDGETAVALATDKAFDVIFMDVQMPGMDGFNACLKIHETDANRDTPVVFVTTHADEETRRTSVQCGGSDFISKPFLCSELTLKALTFSMRGRLQKLKAAEIEGMDVGMKDACLVRAL